MLRIGLIFTLATGCATTEKKPEPQGAAPERAWTHYTLTVGAPEPATMKLPALIPIWINWHKGEKTVATTLGYRGWDFNGDNTIDMLEIVGPEGAAVARMYDFDFDGKIDEPEQSAKNLQDFPVRPKE